VAYFKLISHHSVEGLSESMKSLTRDSRHLGQNSNRGPPGYKAGY